MKIYDHSLYFLELEAGSLVFNWTEKNVHMTYEDFLEACSNYAGYASEYQLSNLLVDTRNFGFRPPEAFSHWRDEIHTPRLKRIGVEKMAYIMKEVNMPYVKDIDEPFRVRHFTSKGEAMNWLTATSIDQ